MNLTKYLFHFPPRENAGGDGGAGVPPAAGAGGAPPPAPTPPAAPAAPPPAATGATGDLAPKPPAWSMPQGFPDRLKADTAEAFYANLEKDWQAQHQKLSGLPQPPKDVSEYTFQPSEKAKPYVGDLSKDPVYTAAQKAALEAGIPKESFAKFIGSIYDGMIDQKLLAEPRDLQAERLEFLGKVGSGMSEDQAIAAIKPEIERLGLFVDGFAQQNELGPKAKAALGLLLGDAGGLQALNALAKAAASPGLRPGGAAPGQGGLTRADLQARQRDPRNDRNSAAYDQNFAKETQALYQKTFG